MIDCTDNEIERSFAKKRCKNIAAKYPMKARKPPPKEEVWCVYVYKCADKYLLIKRPNFGLLANQWEFPSIQYVAGEAIKKSKTEVVEMTIIMIIIIIIIVKLMMKKYHYMMRVKNYLMHI